MGERLPVKGSFLLFNFWYNAVCPLWNFDRRNSGFFLLPISVPAMQFPELYGLSFESSELLSLVRDIVKTRLIFFQPLDFWIEGGRRRRRSMCSCKTDGQNYVYHAIAFTMELCLQFHSFKRGHFHSLNGLCRTFLCALFTILCGFNVARPKMLQPK